MAFSWLSVLKVGKTPSYSVSLIKQMQVPYQNVFDAMKAVSDHEISAAFNLGASGLGFHLTAIQALSMLCAKGGSLNVKSVDQPEFMSHSVKVVLELKMPTPHTLMQAFDLLADTSDTH